MYRKDSMFIVNNKQIEAFPEIDDFLLKKIGSEWRKARQRILNLNFDV